MLLVQAVFFGAGHLAPDYRQLRRRLSAFLHPGNAGSLFFSRSPPKNLEGTMSAAEMGSDEHHSPVAVDSVFMRAYSFHFSSFTSIGMSSSRHHLVFVRTFVKRLRNLAVS